MRTVIIIFFASLFSINANSQIVEDSVCNCDSIFKDIYNNAQYYRIAFQKNQIPKSVKQQLRKKLDGGLNLTNPSRRFNNTDVINPFLKERRLIMYARRSNWHIVVYEQGGMYLSIRVVVLIEIDKDVVYWCENILGGSPGLLFVKHLFESKMYIKKERE